MFTEIEIETILRNPTRVSNFDILYNMTKTDSPTNKRSSINNVLADLEPGTIVHIPLAQPKVSRKKKGTPSKSCTEDASSLRLQDPFLYFSNNKQKMSYLIDEDGDVDQDTASLEVTERKTRISFEVHHSVIFDEILLAMDGLDEDDNSIEDLLCRYTLADRDQAIRFAGQ